MPQRYERIAANDEDESSSSPITQTSHQHYPIPNSPPPSFRSRASSPNAASRRLLAEDPLDEDPQQTLADTFDSPSDDEGSDDENADGLDDRQRLMRANTDDTTETQTRPGEIQRRVTQLPAFSTTTPMRRFGGGSGNDGVFANLSAKPAPGDDVEEKPPTYEQAAADATPPYWETTILAPGMLTDEVVIDGLPVGSLPSLFWNFMITIAFPVVGFLLTYLLHTTHAAKRGSFAGLGVVLIQYGFSLKGSPEPLPDRNGGSGDFGGPPSDPNNHNFNPGDMPDGGNSGGNVQMGITTDDVFAYITMIVGWFILIKSLSDFMRVRRHEQLVLQSPERNAAVAEETSRGEQAV
ncbi:hypothetical protein EJ05DRAFT_476411 [Pseudovirgaria hyperparasitica]|uniref:Metal homeostatis protein bsd2 n=1 Tax=Pseudovirgaria hyperparasitica TaxID=470096 RepID=A0A6A6W869_9PEZI|nr:uncharacterized protein EJ05DRAFT_476411 [Pseudovirgaria hyperparasitica]KAF2758150.1 hypothetical protein EJ05DRAFT_476411 [Pseudovirgaria hyperparasitica]